MQLRSVPVSLAMRIFSPPPLDLNKIKCLACGVVLDWHQPDARLPDRLLGICLDCGHWHTLEFVPAADVAVFVLLPEGRALRTDLIVPKSTSV